MRNVPEAYVEVIRDMYRETTTSIRSETGMENWRMCSGVLCDRKIPVKLKAKVYKTVIRPAMLCAAETWATKEMDEKRLEVQDGDGSIRKKKRKTED